MFKDLGKIEAQTNILDADIMNMKMHSRNDPSTFHYSQHRNNISEIIFTRKTWYIMSIMYSGSLKIGNDIAINLYQSLMELDDHCVLLAAILSNTYSTTCIMTFCMSDTKQHIKAKL